MARGVFAGLLTLDTIYRVETVPAANQKLVARDYTIAAGGPATNAAVTFAHLGNGPILLGALGRHPLARAIRADLETCDRLDLRDLAPERADAPPVSSILVTAATGERAVVSINATRAQLDPALLPGDVLDEAAIVLADGHQMALSRELLHRARARQIPVAIDGGSWKPGFEELLPFVDYAVCSANFWPPGCDTRSQVFAYLAAIPHVAITRGAEPILARSHDRHYEIAVPPIQPADTLGAGDIFHGAFCHFSLQHEFATALARAAEVAARACQSFGTRQWMQADA